MAEGILVLRTPPGRRPSGEQLRIATYEVIYLYRLLPAILDHDHVKVAPTPSATLVQTYGQKWVDRYLEPTEVTGFDAGDGAWEFVAGARRTIRAGDGTLRLETIPELVARLEGEWAARKALAMEDWAAEYEHTGRRLTP